MVKSRISVLEKEFQEQVKLLQAHYEGRVAELRALLEMKQGEDSSSDTVDK